MNILEKIVEQKKVEVARMAKRPASAEHLRWAVKTHGQRRDFATQLRFPRHGKVALIAEVKKASPSKGIIREDFDPVAIARQYEAAGASCISVLTDEQFFQGSLEYMRQIRNAVQLPILRKDFIIDARQILEAVEYGADAILLIVALLSDLELRLFISMAWNAASGSRALRASILRPMLAPSSRTDRTLLHRRTIRANIAVLVASTS